MKPLTISVSGDVRCPVTNNDSFAGLWAFKDQFTLRYVSYVPKQRFKAKNITPHNIVISYEGNDLYRLFLDEKGLHGQWLKSDAITSESFQKLNGIQLGELEIVETKTEQILKEIPLFEPVAVKIFRPSARKIALPTLVCDFKDLGFTDASFKLVDAKAFRERFGWKTLQDDTLEFHPADNYLVQIRLVPKSPVLGSDKEWDIPVEVEIIQVESAELKRSAAQTRVSLSDFDAKYKAAEKEVNAAQKQKQKLQRQWNSNDAKARRADRDAVVLSHKLSLATGNERTKVLSQISVAKNAASNYRNNCNKIQPDLQKAEGQFDDVNRRFQSFKEYKKLLDKQNIYKSEPMTFAVWIPHPLDTKRSLELCRILEPDMAKEKDDIPDAEDKDDAGEEK
ncbi:hypothetical protein FACS189454_00740 [Planctomycetales bacterium]|nr:hypothetical protein FACS189454_00740 [Planctomycetales bacterium]